MRAGVDLLKFRNVRQYFGEVLLGVVVADRNCVNLVVHAEIGEHSLGGFDQLADVGVEAEFFDGLDRLKWPIGR